MNRFEKGLALGIGFWFVLLFCTGMMNNLETKWHIRELKAQTKLLNRIAVAVEKIERAR